MCSRFIVDMGAIVESWRHPFWCRYEGYPSCSNSHIHTATVVVCGVDGRWYVSIDYPVSRTSYNRDPLYRPTCYNFIATTMLHGHMPLTMELSVLLQFLVVERCVYVIVNASCLC